MGPRLRRVRGPAADAADSNGEPDIHLRVNGTHIANADRIANPLKFAFSMTPEACDLAALGSAARPRRPRCSARSATFPACGYEGGETLRVGRGWPAGRAAIRVRALRYFQCSSKKPAS